MRQFASVLHFVLFGVSCLANANQAGELIRRDVPWGQPVNLAEFGGPRIEVLVRSRQMTFVSVDVADYTQMVPVVVNDYSIYGPNRVVMQPARENRRIEKKDGVAFPGSRSSMYLLYREPQSGIHVFFLDEAAGQNRDFLVVGIPPSPPREQRPIEDAPPVAAKSPAVPAQSPGRNDGYLSDDLLDWYLKLQETRDALDLNDTKAVARFNEEAARYHAAVKKERERPKR
jgi:hypothetical protein